MNDQTVEGNIGLVLESFRAVERRDARQLIAVYHPDIEFHDAPSLPYGGVIRGRPGMESHDRAWARTWAPLQPTDAERRMDPRVVAATEREVVVLYRQRAVGPGGERLDGPVVGLYEVRDGKLIRAQMFHYDTAAIVGFLATARDGKLSDTPSSAATDDRRPS